jgi:hypothetical protein
LYIEFDGAGQYLRGSTVRVLVGGPNGWIGKVMMEGLAPTRY